MKKIGIFHFLFRKNSVCELCDWR